MGADSLLADLVGHEVAARLDGVLAPTVHAGAGPAGALSVRDNTLTDMALGLAESLAETGFRLIVFLPIHGGNVEPLELAVSRFNERSNSARACAPRGDVGSEPGSHSGKWLTSVMLAFRADVVELEEADPNLRAELSEADPERGAAYFERFVSSIVEQARA